MNLQSEEFDAKQFISQLIYNSSVDAVRQQIQSFVGTKNSLTNDLQKNVFSNYHEFINVSQQISELERDLAELRELINSMRALNSYNATSGLMGLGEVSSFDMLDASNEEEGRKRHEMLVSQIPELAQFSTTDRKRYLIKEGTNLALVHPGDKSLARSIHLFLYSDLLVLGYRKKKTLIGSGGKKLTQIESHWPLAKLSAIDVSDTSNHQNCFKISGTGGESLLIGAETADVKKSWLLLLRRRIDECRRDSPISPTFEARDLSLSVNDLPQQLLERYRTSVGTFTATGSKLESSSSNNPDIVWLHDMPDQLDVFIAHREFDKAIQCVERSQSILNTYGPSTPALDHLRKGLDLRVSTLVQILSRTLQLKPNAKTISRLCKLGFSTKARDIFLRYQSHIIQSTLASLSFEGDCCAYVHDLTFLFFSLLKKSIKFYRDFFSDLGLSSGLLTWVNSELRLYWDRFRCQVFHEDQTFDVIGECLQTAREGCAVLKEIGVDIGHVFETNSVRKDVVLALEWLRTRVCADLAKSVADDEFSTFVDSKPVQLELLVLSQTQQQLERKQIDEAAKKFRICSSANSFSRLVLKFLTVDLQPILLPTLSYTYYSEITESIVSFFELYFRHVLNLSHDSHFTETQLIVATLSLHYLNNHLMTCLILPLMENSGRLSSPSHAQSQTHQLKHQIVSAIGFNRPIPEWRKLKQRMDALSALLLSSFVLKRTRQLAKATFAFGPACILNSSNNANADGNKAAAGGFMEYSSDAYPVVEKLCPNETMIQLMKQLKQTEESLRQTFEEGGQITTDTLNLPYIMREIVTSFLKDMLSEQNWITEHGYDILFGYTGLHQFILDLHFMMKLSDSYMTPIARKYGEDLCGRALKLYFKRCSDDQKKRRLMGGEFFDKRVIDVLKQPSTGLKKLG